MMRIWSLSTSLSLSLSSERSSLRTLLSTNRTAGGLALGGRRTGLTVRSVSTILVRERSLGRGGGGESLRARRRTMRSSVTRRGGDGCGDGLRCRSKDSTSRRRSTMGPGSARRPPLSRRKYGVRSA
ncbi:hypothetical protein CRV24_009307 [Beauveria bassiana]|nr:hypothetical protein CRV24_009307 [Beauveria bassiana]